MKGQTIRRCKIVFTASLLIIGNAVAVWSQSNSDSFLVRDVVIEAEYTPRFIRRIAEFGIPWDRVTKKSDLSCIREQLLSSGLFSSVEGRFFQLKESGGYQLILSLDFRSSPPVYDLGKVTIFGVDGVDANKFQELLRIEKLSKASVSLATEDYRAFEDRLLELLKDSMPDEEKRDWKKIPWLDLKLNKDEQLEITILGSFKGCS